MLHQSPRRFGKPTSLWTLELAAEVSFEEGPERRAGDGRDRPDHPGEAGGALDEGKAVDHQPRPRVRLKKGAARSPA